MQGDGSAPGAHRSTHFLFAHQVFQAPDARFLLAEDRTPAMVIQLADLTAVVPIRSIRSEFKLDGTPDGALLDQVVAGLKYVRVIRPGDSIPQEILDGSASWTIEDRHLDIARGRLTMQISSWLNGQEIVISDESSLLQLAEDPKIKARVHEAFGEISAKLGISKEDVVGRIEQVARELSYIEALRDRFAVIRTVHGTVAQLMRAYRRDRTIYEELVRIDNLIRRPYREIGEIFEHVDAQSGEVLGLLRNLDAQIAYIRESRDELHIRMMLWDDIVPRWQGLQVERSVENEQEIRELYRFLARNFLTENPWKLASKSFDRRR